jgi:hypothetical protein
MGGTAATAAFALAAAIVVGSALAGTGADELGPQADELLKATLKKMGEGYTGQVDRQRHIVYVSGLDEEHFRQTRELLAAYADAQARTLLGTPPAWNVLILLPTAEDYKKLGIEHNFVGLYEPGKHKLTALDRGAVLLHEFTHALHHADQAAAGQAHPPWVSEGLATLFESARITPGGLEPQVDLRLIALQNAIRDKKAIALESLLKMGSKSFLAQPDLTYAESRYLMLYLHQQGRLRDWYKRYKDTFADDPTGIKALETTLNYKLPEIEKQWIDWAAALKPPLSRRAEKTRLGLEVQDDPTGVKVSALVDGGAAKVAGRIDVGDIIQEFNGQKVTNTVDFVAAVRAAGALQTVSVKLLHQGRPATVLQPLEIGRAHV